MAEAQARRPAQIFRVMFNEITKNAIQKAFEKPLPVNLNLVEAQQARRVLDRLVGYKISPLLWDKVRRGLSAGRVQTVALRLIVEREREIRAFVKARVLDDRRSLNAKKPPVLTARFIKRNNEAVEIADEAAAKGIVARRWMDAVFTCRQSVANAREAAQPGPAFHHLHAAAGILAQAALQREADHDDGARSVRRRGDRQRGLRRSDHLHAYRFDPCLKRCLDRSARLGARAVRSEVHAGDAELLQEQEGRAGCARSDSPDVGACARRKAWRSSWRKTR